TRPLPSPERFQSLTPRESDCLRLVLDHRTAKEMAIEIGISHHAVEKRLKRAREKLGATSSLEAARWFAERYGLTVSGSPDLGLGASQPPISSPSSQKMTSRWRYAAMITVTAALAIALAASQGATDVQASDVATSLERTLSEEIALSKSLFERMDRDRSGALERAEFVNPAASISATGNGGKGTMIAVNREDGSARVLSPSDGGRLELKSADDGFKERRAAMFDLLDRNKDNVIDQEEFTQGQLEGIGPKAFTIKLPSQER
ncbi:MAG: helix-turn-helix transcriptional regulator, partial [Erythrobacter sp.]|nr:helix-turn-helix transcriptional regulator [Erythrobacter sp.]